MKPFTKLRTTSLVLNLQPTYGNIMKGSALLVHYPNA